MEQTLCGTVLEIRTDGFSLVSVPAEPWGCSQTIISYMLFHSNSCFTFSVAIFQQSVLNKFEINVRNCFASNAFPCICHGGFCLRSKRSRSSRTKYWAARSRSFRVRDARKLGREQKGRGRGGGGGERRERLPANPSNLKNAHRLSRLISLNDWRSVNG